MPRTARFLEGPGPYHLTARGSNRQAIFLDDSDRLDFLSRLGRVAARRGVSCFAYCLMGNHIHLVVQAEPDGIAPALRDLLGGHARAFNTRHGRSGHVFGDRFHHVLISDDAQMMATLRYVALNPVRAGLTDAAEAWPWSSYAALVRGVVHPGTVEPDRVLALFAPASAPPGQAITRMRSMVLAGIPEARAEARRRRLALPTGTVPRA